MSQPLHAYHSKPGYAYFDTHITPEHLDAAEILLLKEFHGTRDYDNVMRSYHLLNADRRCIAQLQPEILGWEIHDARGWESLGLEHPRMDVYLDEAMRHMVEPEERFVKASGSGGRWTYTWTPTRMLTLVLSALRQQLPLIPTARHAAALKDQTERMAAMAEANPWYADKKHRFPSWTLTTQQP